MVLLPVDIVWWKSRASSASGAYRVIIATAAGVRPAAGMRPSIHSRRNTSRGNAPRTPSIMAKTRYVTMPLRS